MALNSINNNLERLEEQLFAYKPSLKTKEQKENVSKRLRDQLVDSKPVVKIQRIDAECESLMISLRQRLMMLQDILVPKDKNQPVSRQQKNEQQEEIVKLYLSSDSSDEETISSLMARRREAERRKAKMAKKGKGAGGKKSSYELQQPDTSKANESFLPLAMRRQPRERKFSYKSISSSASTSNSRNNQHHSKMQNRQEQTVTTSGVSYHSEEILVEHEEMDDTPTLHIKIPSLHRGNVHYIILDSLDFARKVFDYRANEVKQQQQQQQSSITHTTKISKTRKKQMKSISSAPILQQLTQQEQELELSQLIQDVMAEACSDETLQATNALENINNNLIDNYESVAQEDFITYSQSSQEISYSQNSNIIDTVCSTSNVSKKQRKNKRSSVDHEQQLNEPQRKRGRKPKKKNNDNLSQPPTKSNLAKYVEFFANDCELMPGSTTPAASSTRSQPLVSSTTQNFEIIDQLGQHQDQQTSPEQQHQQQQQEQQPITYYIDGDWANGGPCQLVATSGMSVNGRQINQEDMNAPFQDFVNNIDNSGDTGNNVIARVLEANHSLPISIPLPIANLGLQNKTLQQIAQRTTTRQLTQNQQQSTVQVINIQIPSLPNTAGTAPPPAHNHKDVLDLSVKSKTNYNTFNNNEALNLNHKLNNIENSCFMTAVQDDCLPLDLSTKGGSGITNSVNTVTTDNQDEEFIRRLIEQSEFQYNNDDLKKTNDNVITYDPENDKSFKAALDMPLLDFDANDLADLVDNGTDECNKQQNNITDKINYTDNTNNNDSNYVSMSAVNSALHFSDHSTSDIFNKLLDICPDKQFLDNVNEFSQNDDLSESVFEQCRVENSTMMDLDKTANEKNILENEKNNEICDTNSLALDSSDKENVSSVLTSTISTDTSLAVQIDSSNNISNSSDVSINFKISFNEDQDKNKKVTIQTLQETETLNLSQDTSKDSQESLNKKEQNDVKGEANKDKQKNIKQTKRRKEKGGTDEEQPVIDLSEEILNLNQDTLKDSSQSLNKKEQKDVKGVEEKELKQIKNHKEDKKSQHLNEETAKENKNLYLKKSEPPLEKDQQKGNKTLSSNKTFNNIKENTQALEKKDSLKYVIEIESNKTNEREKDKQKSKVIEKDIEISEKQTNSTAERHEDHYIDNKSPGKQSPKVMEMDIEMSEKLNSSTAERKDLPLDNKLQPENNKILKSKDINKSLTKTKTKENIVFSVAKITLSDDHLFTHDSDNSSGKSFDGSDEINKETNEDLKEEDKQTDCVSHETLKSQQKDIKALEQETKYSEDNNLKSLENTKIPKRTYEKKIEKNSNKSLNFLQQNLEPNEQEPKYSEEHLKSETKKQTSLDINHNDQESLTQETPKVDNDKEKAINLKSPQKDNDNSRHTLEDMESQETFIINLSSPITFNESSCQLHEENNTQTSSKGTESNCSEVLNLSITSRHENNTESSTEDLIVLNEEDEEFFNDKLQDEGHNVEEEKGEEKDVEMEKVSDATKVEKKPFKDLNENNQQLTLLELESKLEGSLDFEEDYDDTLSLATSCFDSPNDERFEDSSIIEEEALNKPATSTKPPETQSNTNITVNQPPPNKDLKYFKIPKITHKTSNENITVKENEASIEKIKPLEPLPPAAPTPNEMPKLVINLEKITRTVRNDLVTPPATNQNCFDVLQPPLQNETPALVKILQKVFGITCLPFLIDKCYAITHCQQSHQFNDVDTVYKTLNTLDKLQVNSSYQLMYNHVKLYKLYFQIFCSFYTNKQDRVKLLNMVNDCERYPEYADYLIILYESLVSCGLSRVNACRLILKRIRENCMATTIIEALVAIIMKSDWTMFMDSIEKYTQEVYKFNYRITILEQMAPAVLNSKGPQLKQLFGKCVQTLHPNDTGLLLNSPVLIQCVALLTTNT